MYKSKPHSSTHVHSTYGTKRVCQWSAHLSPLSPWRMIMSFSCFLSRRQCLIISAAVSANQKFAHCHAKIADCFSVEHLQEFRLPLMNSTQTQIHRLLLTFCTSGLCAQFLDDWVALRCASNPPFNFSMNISYKSFIESFQHCFLRAVPCQKWDMVQKRSFSVTAATTTRAVTPHCQMWRKQNRSFQKQYIYRGWTK